MDSVSETPQTQQADMTTMRGWGRDSLGGVVREGLSEEGTSPGDVMMRKTQPFGVGNVLAGEGAVS